MHAETLADKTIVSSLYKTIVFSEREVFLKSSCHGNTIIF